MIFCWASGAFVSLLLLSLRRGYISFIHRSKLILVRIIIDFTRFFRGTIWVLTRFAMRKKKCRHRSQFSARDEYRKFTFQNPRALSDQMKRERTFSRMVDHLHVIVRNLTSIYENRKNTYFFRWVKIVPEKKKWNQFSGHLYDAYIILIHIHRHAKQFERCVVPLCVCVLACVVWNTIVTYRRMPPNNRTNWSCIQCEIVCIQNWFVRT